MATDATGTPTSLGIPRYNTGVDKPTGAGFNAAMGVIDTLITNLGVGIPAGVILPYGGTTAPTGFFLCDGTAYSTSTYATLYAAISLTYGSGGTGTFRVPDLRSRMPLGSGQGAGLSDRSLGQTGGAETHALSSGELAAHTHSSLGGVLGGFGQTLQTPVSGGSPVTLWGVPSGQASTDMQTGSQGSGTAHENMSPFLVVNFIIKT